MTCAFIHETEKKRLQPLFFDGRVIWERKRPRGWPYESQEGCRPPLNALLMFAKTDEQLFVVCGNVMIPVVIREQAMGQAVGFAMLLYARAAEAVVGAVLVRARAIG
jgi:hypothetical protein